MKRVLFFTVLLCIAACANQTAKFGNANVTAIGSDEPNSLCQNFKLTNKEALTFFTRAHEISAVDMHNQYDYLPCYVKGTITQKYAPQYSTCSFAIRAGGTAELTCNEEVIKFYGCKTCDNLLSDKP